MPDGKVYNGCLCLKKDIDFAVFSGIDIEDPTSMADYYGVSTEEYMAGQEWACEHLADLRREAGLDTDTGLPVQPTNAVEASTLPTQRRNVYHYKVSIAAHAVRRPKRARVY